ncbi:hypothetical protein GCM10009780_81280 [Actinomadura alba]
MVDTAEALLDAITSGDSAALTRLFADDVDPATSNDDGDPMVLDAADTGKVELVRPFLDAGLPVDPESDLGITPLMCAVSTGSLPLVEFSWSHRSASPRNGGTAKPSACCASWERRTRSTPAQRG